MGMQIGMEWAGLIGEKQKMHKLCLGCNMGTGLGRDGVLICTAEVSVSGAYAEPSSWVVQPMEEFSLFFCFASAGRSSGGFSRLGNVKCAVCTYLQWAPHLS